MGCSGSSSVITFRIVTFTLISLYVGATFCLSKLYKWFLQNHK